MFKIKTALVAGASGSGKTLIASMFQKAYVHTMDYYFRPPFPVNVHGIPEWDRPEAIDFDEWLEDYIRIKQAISESSTLVLNRYRFEDQKVHQENFDGSDHENIKWIIIEGLFALDPRLHKFADLKIFVEAPFQLRVSRRLIRDLHEREQDLMFVLMHSYYTELSYQQYIEPQKEFADLVIPNYEVSSEEMTLKKFRKS